jgi:thiol-disulfide isomerase/thioredoxin
VFPENTSEMKTITIKRLAVIGLMIVGISTNLSASVSKVRVITHGARVDIARHVVIGRVTLVDFYADWCGPCRMISPHLESLAASNPQIVLRKIDIVRWNTPICQQYQINGVPQVWVFDKRGRFVGRVEGVDIASVNALVARAL